MGTIYGNPIVWRKIEDNHSGYPTGSTTIITNKIITNKCFDATEPNNTNGWRKGYGNGRYSVSNVRQWLNSNAAAGTWYTPQHSADQAPDSAHVGSGDPYDTAAGLLNGFTAKEQSLLIPTSLIVALNAVDGGGSETVTDKIFLLSEYEMAGALENGIAEGTIFSYFYGTSYMRQFYPTADMIAHMTYAASAGIKTTSPYTYLLRSPIANTNSYSCAEAHFVSTLGDPNGITDTYNSSCGIVCACNIPQSTKVSKVPDSNGVYSLA